MRRMSITIPAVIACLAVLMLIPGQPVMAGSTPETSDSTINITTYDGYLSYVFHYEEIDQANGPPVQKSTIATDLTLKARMKFVAGQAAGKDTLTAFLLGDVKSDTLLDATVKGSDLNCTFDNGPAPIRSVGAANAGLGQPVDPQAGSFAFTPIWVLDLLHGEVIAHGGAVCQSFTPMLLGEAKKRNDLRDFLKGDPDIPSKNLPIYIQRKASSLMSGTCLESSGQGTRTTPGPNSTITISWTCNWVTYRALIDNVPRHR